jgi:hypothetical protein
MHAEKERLAEGGGRKGIGAEKSIYRRQLLN